MKKSLAILLSAFMILSVLSGCGGNSASESPTTTVAEQPSANAATAESTTAASNLQGKITFMVLDSFAKKPTDAIYTAEKRFEEKYPGVDVTIEPVAGASLKDKYTSVAMAGTGPDIVSLDTGGWIVDDAAIGIIAPLDDQLAAIKDEFQPGAVEAGKFSGHYYAVPWYVNNTGLFYNKTMLAEAGINAPPKTWDEFAADIAAVTAKGHKGLAVTIDASYFMYPFFFQNGNHVIDTSGEKPVASINNESGKEAFKFFSDIHTKYDGFPESTKDALSWDQVYAPFIQGDVAFIMSGDWADYTISSANPKFEYGIAPLPVGKEAGTVMGGYSLAINKNTKNFDAAWEFVKFLTANEQNDILLSYNRIGARKDIDKAALVAANPKLQTFIEQAMYAYARPTIKALTESDQYFSDAFKEVYLGEKDADTALADCEKRMNALIAEKYK